MVHILVFHLFKIKKRFRAIKTIFYIFSIVYVLSYLHLPPDLLVLLPADPLRTSGLVLFVSNTLNFITGYMLYLFLFFGYCQFYFFIARTITGRMMIELEMSPEKKLSYEEMKRIYPPNDVFKRRLQDMLDSECILLENGRYRNTKKGHYIAVISGFLKNFLRLDPGG